MDATPSQAQPAAAVGVEELGVVTGGPAARAGGRRLLIRGVVALVILAALAVAGRRYYGELDRLKSVSPWLVAAIAALYVAGRLPGADLLHVGLRALGHHVGRAEAFFVLMVQYYVNMLIPRAGIGALAGYLKLRHNVPVGDLGAAQILMLMLPQFAVLGVAALACQAGLAAAGVARWDPVLGVVFAAVALANLVPLVVPIPALDKGPAGPGVARLLGRFLARLADACRRLGRDRRLLARAAVAHAAVLLLRAWRVQLSFYAVGQPVGFWPAFVASAAADVMFLVSVTPGALGFREGGIVYAARVLGTPGDLALAAAVLDRIILTGCNLVLGQIGIWRYVGRAGGRDAC